MTRYWSACLLLVWQGFCPASPAPGPQYRIETVAGGADPVANGSAVVAQLGNIQGVAADSRGNLYVSDTDRHVVRKVSASGLISTLAGTGVPGSAGDGGPAASAQLNLPYGLAVDAAGNVYIADLGNNRLRRVSTDGTIATVAGNGQKRSSGDGGPASAATLATPRNVAVDAAGNIYVSEFEGHRIRKIAPDGRIETAAGTGAPGLRGDGGPAALAQFNFPAGLAVDLSGALYVADSQNHRVRKIFPGGVITTLLGGTSGTALLTPTAVAVNPAGAVYVADRSRVVRVYSPSGAWSTVAGTGEQGFAGDGGPAQAARLNAANDLAVDPAGGLYLADGARLRRVSPFGVIATVAGDGYTRFVGDGGAATAALLARPSAVALDAAGNLYVADTGAQRIRRVSPAGRIDTLAGFGVAGFGGDGAPASTALLNSPMGVSADAWGNLAIADTGNHRARLVSADGRIRTVVGTGTAGLTLDGQPGGLTPLNGPRSVCFDPGGALIVVDTANHRVLRLPPGGLPVTVAGNSLQGGSGDGGGARFAQLNQPGACALDASGNLFIADTGNHRVRKVTVAGVISAVAGTGTAGFAGDEGPATEARLQAPLGVAVDSAGNVFIADSANHRLRKVTPDGVIHTIAGDGAPGFSGDGGDALGARLNLPAGLALDASGNLWVADTENSRIRKLTPVPDKKPVADPVAALPRIAVASAASMRAGPVAPGEIVSIFGEKLGPEAASYGEFSPSGAMRTVLGDCEVRFGGVPAPLFYAQSSQINAQAPYTIAGRETAPVEVECRGELRGSATVLVAATAPALFSAAFNQDGSPNAETNPSASGAVVTFFATGEGLTDGPNLAGMAANAPYPRPLAPVSLSVGGLAAEILYAGAAPGLVGVLQVNARIPAPLPTGKAAAELAVGAVISPPVSLWLR